MCYGPRIKALGSYLVSYQHLPCERAAELLSDWLGAPVSVGSLQAWVAAGATGLEGFLEEIRAQLECAESRTLMRPAGGSTVACSTSTRPRPRS